MTTICKTIRREIDEADLDGPLSRNAVEHLRSCSECRRFQDDQRSLRGLIGSLKAVAAPADFDFRLRARLARGDSRNGFGRLLFGTWPITAAALVILLAVLAVSLRNRTQSKSSVDSTAKSIIEKPSPAPVAGPTAAPDQAPIAHNEKLAQNLGTQSSPSPRNRLARLGSSNPATPSPVSPVAVKNGAPGIREMSLGSASAVTPASPSFVIGPIGVRGLKVSVDNGRGAAHTISLPAVSFGSQRLLARESSFAPPSPGKGDW